MTNGTLEVDVNRFFEGDVHVITGPTGVGKTIYVEELRKHYDAVLINGDASCFHRHLKIGVANPGKPYHLINMLDWREKYTPNKYVENAVPVIRSALLNRKKVFIVGGSMYYLSFLINKFHPRYSNSESLLYLVEHAPKFRIHVMLRYRDDWTYHLSRRIHKMCEEGWLTEVRQLIEDYPDNDLPELFTGRHFNAIGYKEAYLYLNGSITYNDFIESTLIKSRQYAKRQVTWLRNQLWDKVNHVYYV